MKTTLALFSFVLITGLATAQVAVQQTATTTGDNTTYTYELISDPAVLGLPSENNKMSDGEMVNTITVRMKAIEGVSEVAFDETNNHFTVVAASSTEMPANFDAIARDIVADPQE